METAKNALKSATGSDSQFTSGTVPVLIPVDVAQNSPADGISPKVIPSQSKTRTNPAGNPK